MLNGDKPKADYYAAAGLNVITVHENKFVPIPGTETVSHPDEDNDGYDDFTDELITDDTQYELVKDAVARKRYWRIFLNFGVNELGRLYPETFVEQYEKLIYDIKASQPDADIYVISMLPVSYEALSINGCYTNENVDRFNQDYILRVAMETGCVYLDVNRLFKDSLGNLPYGAASDGIHMIRSYCLEWMDVLAYYTTGEG